MQKISRRDFLKITAIAGGGLIGASLISKGIWTQPYIVTDTRTLMGTIIHLKLVCEHEEEGRAALDTTFAAMKQLVMMFNLRDENSQVSRLNQSGELRDASAEMLEVLSQAHRFGDLTSGAFDVTIQPILSQIRSGREMETNMDHLVDYKKIKISGSTISFQTPGMGITLDGIAKGYVVDRGVDTLKLLGFERVLVEAGGDLVVSCNDFDSEGWKIGVASPRPKNQDGYLAVFSIRDGAVATSGDYLNSFTEDKSSHHIIDPISHRSPNELASVTVHALTALEADALSTAIMVMGADAGLELANGLDRVEALVVTKEMTIRRTKGFPTSTLI